MDILSYDDLKYSGESRGGARVTRPPPPPPLNFETKLRPKGRKSIFADRLLPPPPPLISRSGSGAGNELYLFNNAFVWYSGYKVG